MNRSIAVPFSVLLFSAQFSFSWYLFFFKTFSDWIVILYNDRNLNRPLKIIKKGTYPYFLFSLISYVIINGGPRRVHLYFTLEVWLAMSSLESSLISMFFSAFTQKYVKKPLFLRPFSGTDAARPFFVSFSSKWRSPLSPVSRPIIPYSQYLEHWTG